MICYVDGEEAYGRDVVAVPQNIEDTQIVFGCYGPSQEQSFYFFNGMIDELKIFNRVLTEEELGFKS